MYCGWIVCYNLVSLVSSKEVVQVYGEPPVDFWLLYNMQTDVCGERKASEPPEAHTAVLGEFA